MQEHPLRRQRSLGARHLALPPLHPGDGGPQRHGGGLEGALGPVMVVLAAQAVDVQSDTGSAGKGLEAVGDHLGGKVADALAAEAEVDDAVGAVREVDNGAREGLVERAVGGAEAGDADRSAEGGMEGVAKSNADVLGCVVVVDCKRGGMVSDICSSGRSLGGERERERERADLNPVGERPRGRGRVGMGADVLCRSPLQTRARLQPECFASACSMWSRKPMPVFMRMVCDLLFWAAWSSPAERRRLSVSGGKSPPSRLSAIWMLVSLVSRAMAAQRGAESEGDIVGGRRGNCRRGYGMRESASRAGGERG